MNLEEYNDVITIKDVAQILGIGRLSATKLIKDGKIPSKKIGRLYRIRKQAVLDYLSENDTIK